MSYVRLQGISKTFHSRTLFADLDLNIQAEDRLALIGENGAGKTTLLKIICGDEAVDTGRVTKAGGLRIGYLKQQIERENTHLTAWEATSGYRAEKKQHELLLALDADESENDVSSKCEQTSPQARHQELLAQYQTAVNEFEALGGYSFAPRWFQTINALGLPQEIADRPLAHCSGGERMRLALAQILLDAPDLLLLDEPTNHLDLPAIEWLINYLKSFKGSLIIISHDRYFLDQIANKCLFLEQETLRVFAGSYSEAKALKEEEDRFLASKRKELVKELAHQQEVTQTFLSHRNISGYHSRQKLVKKLSEELARIKANETKGPSKMSFHFTAPKDLGDPNRIILAAQDLHKEFPTRLLFSHLNLSIKAHDKIILLGTNGSGKSTLLNILAGRDGAFSGQIRGSQNLSIATMSQTVTFADEESTCLTTLMTETDLGEPESRNLLARFGFKEIDVYKKVGILSGGERSRLYLCSILEQKPSLLFLDEPTNHLDIYSREILEKAISQYDGAILAITHDRYFASQFANRYCVLTNQTLSEYDHLQEAIRTQLEARLKSGHQNDEARLLTSKTANVGSAQTVTLGDASTRTSTTSTASVASAVSTTPTSTATAASSTTSTDSPTSPTNPASPKLNPSQRRKQIAQLQGKIKEIEAKIQKVEEELQDLNAQTGPSSSLEHYHQIASLTENLTQLEDDYLTFTLELEELQAQ